MLTKSDFRALARERVRMESVVLFGLTASALYFLILRDRSWGWMFPRLLPGGALAAAFIGGRWLVAAPRTRMMLARRRLRSVAADETWQRVEALRFLGLPQKTLVRAASMLLFVCLIFAMHARAFSTTSTRRCRAC